MRTSCVPGAAETAGDAAGLLEAPAFAAGLADADAAPELAGLAAPDEGAADGLAAAEDGAAAEGEAAEGAAAWPPQAARSDKLAAPTPSRRK